MSAELQEQLDAVTKHRDQLKAELDALNPKHAMLHQGFEAAGKRADELTSEVGRLQREVEVCKESAESWKATAAKIKQEVDAQMLEIRANVQIVQQALNEAKADAAAWQARAKAALRRDQDTFAAVQRIAAEALNIMNARGGAEQVSSAGG